MSAAKNEIGKGDPNRRPVKADFQKDKVYLFQFGRAGCLPSVSPYCLKLETWLRMANIPFENLEANLFKNTSHEGKLPFIELNGKEIADSGFICRRLATELNKDLDAHLSSQEKATAFAYESLIEDTLFWAGYYFRQRNVNELFSDDVLGRSLGLMGYLKGPVKFFLARQIQKKLYEQGMGRHSPEEVIAIGKECIDALHAYLGDKQYLTGNKPTRLDATAFGHLSQLVYVPPETELQRYIKQERPKLVDYLERIKKQFWPDWDELLKTRAMNIPIKQDENKTATE